MQSPRVAAALAAAITAQPLPAPERRASDADVAARQQIEGDSRDEDGQGEAGAGAEGAPARAHVPSRSAGSVTDGIINVKTQLIFAGVAEKYQKKNTKTK